jgi:hypothetical protein
MPKQANKRARSSKRRAATHAVSARSDFSDMHTRAAGQITNDIQRFITMSEPETNTQQAVQMPPPNGTRLMGEDSANRKRYPVTTGFLDYFPDAVQAAAEVSFVGNEKHNPGEALHHSRGKSNDHADCIARHLMERGGFVYEVIGDKTYRIRHSAAMLWRAAALLQEELEAEGLCSLPRAAKLP